VNLKWVFQIFKKIKKWTVKSGFKCVDCGKPASYVSGGDTYCEECFQFDTEYGQEFIKAIVESGLISEKTLELYQKIKNQAIEETIKRVAEKFGLKEISEEVKNSIAKSTDEIFKEAKKRAIEEAERIIKEASLKKRKEEGDENEMS